MLKIGEFSKIGRVSVKALRLYDEMDLLRAAHIDPHSGYRHYTIDQLPRLNRILALKDLGFSLEQVADVLNEGLSPEQLRGMLRLKRAELQQSLQEDQERLARVEARLRLIEQEGRMPDYEVVLKTAQPQLVASIRERLARYSDVGRLFEELYTYVGPLGVAGQCAAIWHDREYKESDVDGEGVVFIQRPVPETDRVKVAKLPGCTVAAVVHRGSYRTLSQAYAALLRWIEANGYRAIGADRELYLQGGSSQDDDSYVTEIQMPVEKK